MLEVIVAMAILGISLGVIMDIFSNGIRGAFKSRRHNQAVFLAQGKMEELLIKKDLEEGTEEGDFEGMENYRWQTSVEEVELFEDECQPVPEDVAENMDFFKVYALTVRVSWGQDEADSYKLQTVKLFKNREEEQLIGL